MAGSEVTIRVIATKPGYTDSQVVSATYTVTSTPPTSTEWTMVSTPNIEEICALRGDVKSASKFYTDISRLADGISLFIDAELSVTAQTNAFYLDINDPDLFIWFYDRETNALINTGQQCR